MIWVKYSLFTWGYSLGCLQFKLRIEKDAQNLYKCLGAVAICTLSMYKVSL